MGSTYPYVLMRPAAPERITSVPELVVDYRVVKGPIIVMETVETAGPLRTFHCTQRL